MINRILILEGTGLTQGLFFAMPSGWLAATIAWIAITFSIDIHGVQRMNPNDYILT